jgi:hypothetical protein
MIFALIYVDPCQDQSKYLGTWTLKPSLIAQLGAKMSQISGMNQSRRFDKCRFDEVNETAALKIINSL